MASQTTSSGRTQHSAFIDNALWQQFRQEAFERQCSVADVLDEVLRAGVEALAARKEPKAEK